MRHRSLDMSPSLTSYTRTRTTAWSQTASLLDRSPVQTTTGVPACLPACSGAAALSIDHRRAYFHHCFARQFLPSTVAARHHAQLWRLILSASLNIVNHLAGDLDSLPLRSVTRAQRKVKTCVWMLPLTGPRSLFSSLSCTVLSTERRRRSIENPRGKRAISIGFPSIRTEIRSILCATD
jgi:hypothetical protein